MNVADYLVLLGTMIGIAVIGLWQTRGRKSLSAYLKSGHTLGWGTIGLSVMATQASAITFLSTPGQAFESGLGFVQNYLGLPIALVIVAAVFLPIYRRLDVYTAYEYLGRRFDGKTRLLGAALFLLQRGLASGITIYAPAIILSTVLGWRLDATIVCTGLFVIIYTVTGGNEAVSVTQKWQMAVILAGLAVAFGVLLWQLPVGVGPRDALAVAGSFGKLEAIDFSLDVNKRYTFWSGLLGGVFLMLSYFGTDQSQVQRYLSGGSLRASRLGLMFNAVLKIPMQFFILLLGTLVFVFYQFNPSPVFFNDAAWQRGLAGAHGAELARIESDYTTARTAEQQHVRAWLAARHAAEPAAADAAHTAMLADHARADGLRRDAKQALAAADPRAKTNDADYVFITFVVRHMPHGVIGLLIALIFAAAVSSLASELAALGSTTAVDFYRHLIRPGETDAHYVTASKWLTMAWGFVAVGFAIFADFAENLIQAVNILGSLFYGVVLGLFLVAFFVKRIGGTAVFWGGLVAQALVFTFYATLPISYLWYNVIGCVACIALSALFQLFGGGRAAAQPSPV